MPGPTVTALRIGGPIAPWRAAGFVVADSGRCQVGAVELRVGGSDRGMLGWTLTGAGAGDVDGIPTEHVPQAPPAARDAPSHPNTAVSVDHVVVRSADVSATVAALSATGMRLRGERAAGSPGARLRQGFFRHGEVIIEVVGPDPPAPSAPSTLWGLTVTVSDIEACATRLGHRLGPIRPAVQPGRRIATVTRAADLGIRLAVMSP